MTGVTTFVQLPAQRTTLQLIIMACGFDFATEQRKDAYYRNDPKKYGLNILVELLFNSLFEGYNLLVAFKQCPMGNSLYIYRF